MQKLISIFFRYLFVSVSPKKMMQKLVCFFDSHRLLVRDDKYKLTENVAVSILGSTFTTEVVTEDGVEELAFLSMASWFTSRLVARCRGTTWNH